MNASSSRSGVPLCVDLDGTLIRSDLLVESALALLRRNPLHLFAMPFWLLRGRAHLKHQIAKRVQIDVPTLPWDTRVLDLVKEQRAQRPTCLCTASDGLLANAVAEHVGIFDAVMASDGKRNLSGRTKASALVDRFGDHRFDYAGDAARDLTVWKHAHAAFVVNASASTCARVKKACEVAREFPREHAGIRDWLGALRVHQWLKNLLVFVPLVAAHLALVPGTAIRASIAFAIFCVCASSVYMLNDLLDLEADRKHPRKRNRPFAAGRLPLAAGLAAAPLLAIAAFIAAYALAPRFASVLLGYYVLTLAYSLKLKQVVMLDVIVLAALYTLRIIAGGVVIGTGSSFWLLAFSMFVFLSLAILKRYTELGVQREAGNQKLDGRGYHTGDYELLASLGGASGYLSVLVLALYINSTASAELYRHPQVLWLLCPLLLFWISRAWIIAHRSAMHDDPVIFAVTDNVSRWLMLIGAAIALLAI